MGTAQSKKDVLKFHDTKAEPPKFKEEEEETIIDADQATIMPSIEQCESASGSVAALPSTLEIFDKFKSVSDNGKDSDSEESFHLPLDDDDMESQSVVSNGRDKEIHNEETEDDILNKFETVPSGTPDHIDPHIEDSILDDVENLTDKQVDDIALSENCVLNKEAFIESSENETNEETTPLIEKPINKTVQDENETKTEVKLTYDFGEYEDSGDGEFRSVYETDELTTEGIDKEAQPESTEHAELAEPMEITEEPASVECTSQEIEKHRPLQESLQNVEETLENFEDSMEVEQEDTNQDIANIIEKLEDQDTPMEDVESSALNDEGDINMIESCEQATLTSEGKNIENTKKTPNNDNPVPEKEFEETSDDVEMIGDAQINEEPQENCKENFDQAGSSESAEMATTFQERLESSQDTTEACSRETQEQIDVNNEDKCSYNKIQSSENEKNIENQAVPDENKKLLEDEALSVENKTNDGPVKSEDIIKSKDRVQNKDLTESTDFIENEENLCKNAEEESTEILQESLKSVAESESEGTAEVDTNQPLENTKNIVGEKNLVVDKPIESKTDDLKNDDLLKELEETINQSDEDELKATEKNIIIENKETKPSKESEKDEKESESTSSNDEEVFKVPEEVLKVPEEASTQTEEKEGPDIQNEKSNDKTDEDESDLLDISMVRETEEDDACAIADALNDKDAQTSEKSDEEQSEKVETEQEGSDIDKDNDNEPIDFDDTDDDSRIDDVEHDDSSNVESVKNKIIDISESSKDILSEGASKKRKKTVESYIDISSDGMSVEVSASESGEEPEKLDSLVPDKSLNLESTLVQDEADLSTTFEKDTSTPPVPKEDETENKEEQESSKTDRDNEKTKDSPMVQSEVTDDSLPQKSTEESSEREKKKSPFKKRTLSASDKEDAQISAKKPKLAPTVAAGTQKQKGIIEKTAFSNKKPVEKDFTKDVPSVNEKVKTLTGFSQFMQCRKFTEKLSRSDLEQFCIQKICEILMLKSSEGEMHQTIKKHEKTIDYMRKDVQQLTKQCKDLEIVNKKLMNELRNQNVQKKPLVPLKITRSVGLQVRLNPGNETPNQNRRRPNTGTTPQKPMANSTNTTGTRVKVTTGNVQQPAAVRQVLQNSPQKSPLTTGQTTTTTNSATPTNPLLSQALQQQKPRQAPAVAAKRTATPVRKTPEAAKPGNAGVIDLTDEDDRLGAAKTVAGNTIKIVNKTVSPAGTANKTVTLGKMVAGKTVTNQGKAGVQKTVAVGQNKGNALSQGIRLTPASVITSSANGSPQMVYVVPTITSNAGGTQKVAFVNFQPTNGVLSGTLNGSTVSVMSNKGQTLTLKTVPSPMRPKHPATLPAPPRINLDPKLKPLLPKPHLTIKKIDTGIILQWKMPYNLDLYESIASYQLYAYQETSSPPSTDMWRKVGDVKALALPMACTLTQFADKNKYYFAVRSVDVHKRIGAFSDPEEISL